MRRLLLLCVLLLAGCGTAAPTPSPIVIERIVTATPAPVPTLTGPVQLTGQSSTDTAHFALADGDYFIHWQAADPSDATKPCPVRGVLYASASVGSGQDFGEQSNGETRLNGLIGGDYYVFMAALCPWQVTITPVQP